MARKIERAEPDATKEALVNQYHAIGPAALLAALLCMPKSRVTVPAPARKAA